MSSACCWRCAARLLRASGTRLGVAATRCASSPPRRALDGPPGCRHGGYFVDLFVRERNALAIGMYRKFGYEVYRRVLGYYGDNGEDAYGEPQSTINAPREDLHAPRRRAGARPLRSSTLSPPHRVRRLPERRHAPSGSSRRAMPVDDSDGPASSALGDFIRLAASSPFARPCYRCLCCSCSGPACAASMPHAAPQTSCMRACRLNPSGRARDHAACAGRLTRPRNLCGAQ